MDAWLLDELESASADLETVPEWARPTIWLLDSRAGGCAGAPSTTAESSEPGPPSQPESGAGR